MQIDEKLAPPPSDPGLSPSYDAAVGAPDFTVSPPLTRRALVIGSAGTLAATAVGGILKTAVRAASRFPDVAQFDAEVPTVWSDLSLDLVMRTAGYTPPVASRAFGYVGITLYEALVAGMDGFRSLAGVVDGLGGLQDAGKSRAYDWPTVANAALAFILRNLFPTAPDELLNAIDALEVSIASRRKLGLPPGIFARSVARGHEIAAAVFEWSKTDGGHEGYLRNFPTDYVPPVGPGFWVPTPPGFLRALQPSWGGNRCLAIAGGTDCPPGDPPAYSEHAESSFHAAAVEVYETAKALTPEQERIARFWSDEPGVTANPAGHSISITTQVLRRMNGSLADAAETYAKIGIAVYDAFIACWHQKYTYNLLRPVTYIQNLIDPNWFPLLTTPPFPEYPSGHSVQSTAALRVLTDLFGQTYPFPFVDHTHDARGIAPRRFDSFLEAAEEAAISRLYGGIHFRAAVENGMVQGHCIGQAVSALPVRF